METERFFLLTILCFYSKNIKIYSLFITRYITVIIPNNLIAAKSQQITVKYNYPNVQCNEF